jgi:hypothetical protein
MPAPMSRRFKRWLSILMLGTLAFAQVNLVFAACAMDRGQLAQMISQPADHDCCDQDTAPGAMPMAANGCFVQSTSDLQTLAAPMSFEPAPAAVTLLLPLPESRPVALSRWSVPPPKAVPPRILLHSFLI